MQHNMPALTFEHAQKPWTEVMPVEHKYKGGQLHPAPQLLQQELRFAFLPFCKSMRLTCVAGAGLC